MSQLDPAVDHLLRRAGFGASAADVETYRDMSPAAAVAHLVDYAGRPDDVDERIGRPDHVQVSTNNLFAPDIDIDDARQRWMFRMVHSRRPLQEKMAMFWHNHFATAYSKLANDSGTRQAAKLLAAKPGSLRGPMGQIELFREYGMGSYRDLLFRASQDAAMVIWLDGQFNTKAKPVQANTGNQWLSNNDPRAINGVLTAARAITPGEGTSLVNAFLSVRTMNPEPDQIILITDGLPTQGAAPPAIRKTVDGEQRLKLFQKALGRLPSGIPVNTILLPMEGDPMAPSAFWALARKTKGVFLSPARDWP